MKKVLLDFDIGTEIDDAIAYLLANPECELVGITTSCGESIKRAEMASVLCRAAGKKVPIHAGCERPLLIPQMETTAPQAAILPHYEHDTGFAPNTAIPFMQKVIRENPGEVTLLAVAPMTNLGLLFAMDPELPELLDGLYLLCGSPTHQRHDVVTESLSAMERDDFIRVLASRLGGILYSYWPALDYTNAGAEPARTREYSLESMAVIADEAASRGIQLNLEVVNRYENFVFNDVDGALAYITELGRGNVKLLLDVFHMNIEEDDIGAAIRRAGAAVGHFHIGECNRRVPGKGHMPWADIGAALRDIGYDGPVVMEPFVRSGGEVADAIRVWHDLTRPDSDARLDEDLKQALSFTRSMLYSEN